MAARLARLLSNQSRWAEAQEPLAPTYGWLSEDFDTARIAAEELGTRDPAIKRSEAIYHQKMPRQVSDQLALIVSMVLTKSS